MNRPELYTHHYTRIFDLSTTDFKYMTDSTLKFASLFQDDSHIASVIAVEPGSIIIEVLARPNAQASLDLGGFILVSCGEAGLFAQIDRIWSVSSPGSDLNETMRGSARTLSTIKLDGSVSLNEQAPPYVGASVHLAPSQLIETIVSSANSFEQGCSPLVLHLAKLVRKPDVSIKLTPEIVFGRHCAVLGTTGGGKSWTVAKLLEQSARFNSKIILFDATGEYHTLNEGVRHVYLGEDPDPLPCSTQVALPYNELNEDDLFGIFAPRGPSQAPKLREAIRTLKLLHLDPGLGLNGLMMKANRSKVSYLDAYERYGHLIELPNAKFDIQCLPRQIENECIKLNRSALETDIWGDYSSVEQSNCISLVNRVNDIVTQPSLSSIFNPARLHSLNWVIADFIAESHIKILRISLKYLPFAHNARPIVANAIGRMLLAKSRERAFKYSPLVMVIDEAHQFLGELQAGDESFNLNSFGLIAKEGRKYSISVCLATQRPRDIPEDVLSQVGTLFVHRLINDRDRLVVERATGVIDQASMDLLPTLAPGRALLAGVEFPIPMVVQMDPPLAKPESHGANYQRFWGDEAISAVELPQQGRLPTWEAVGFASDNDKFEGTDEDETDQFSNIKPW